jgi:hypothetical protein
MCRLDRVAAAALLALSCSQRQLTPSELVNAKSLHPPQPRCGEQPTETLFVFVGRKISLRPVGVEVPPGQPFILDEKYLGEYEVLRVLCGVHPSDHIEFEVYDHYGVPAFAEFATVLLYVSRYNGRLVHEKYLYNPVYETKDGGWAGCGDPYALDHVHRGHIRALQVSFKAEVSFPIANVTESEGSERYPAAYFARRGDRFFCMAGASIDSLFAIKRDGYLRARGIFR